jgi:hypothetical protein
MDEQFQFPIELTVTAELTDMFYLLLYNHRNSFMYFQIIMASREITGFNPQCLDLVCSSIWHWYA